MESEVYLEPSRTSHCTNLTASHYYIFFSISLTPAESTLKGGEVGKNEEKGQI